MERALPTRQDLHLARKIWHFSGVVLMATLYTGLEKDKALRYLVLASVLVGGLDLLRQHWPALNRCLTALFLPFMRKEELHRTSGLTYMLLGITLATLFFPKEIVVLSLLLFALSDPAASYFGLKYGRDRLWGSKSLQGALAAFITSTLVGVLYFYLTGALLERVVLASLLTGFIGTLSELAPIGRLDDNLTFPLVSCTLLWGLYVVFEGGGF